MEVSESRPIPRSNRFQRPLSAFVPSFFGEKERERGTARKRVEIRFLIVAKLWCKRAGCSMENTRVKAVGISLHASCT